MAQSAESIVRALASSGRKQRGRGCTCSALMDLMALFVSFIGFGPVAAAPAPFSFRDQVARSGLKRDNVTFAFIVL